MFKKVLILLLVFSFMAGASQTAYAECSHNFECDKSKWNLKCNSDMSHSYYCLNGCGSYGTVSGGVNGSEKCTFSLAVVKEATCTEEGMRYYMCTVCYRGRDERIPISEHNYVRECVLPTCTREGYELYTCSGCGDSYKLNVKAPVAHITDGGVIEVLPSEGKGGVLKVSCRVCNTVTERKTLNALAVVSEQKSASVAVGGFRVKSCTESSVKLLWNKSEYALSYRISYSTDRKKWKTVSASGTGVTVKNLKPSRKYYFKISAVCDGAYSEESGIISVCTRPSKAVIIKAASGKNGTASVKWKKQSAVSGYELSYSLKKFTGKGKTKKLNVTKGTEKTLKKLKSGKKYYVRVRAYKKFGSEKIYGAYSKTFTVKIK